MVIDALTHHGVKGQRWGVRRFKDDNNQVTREGLLRDRANKAFKTKEDVDSIINTLSKKDKKLLNLSSKEYLSKEEGQFVVKRFSKKYGDTPVSFLDLIRDGDDLVVAVATRSGKKYRGKGYAKSISKRGMDWVNKNKDKWDTIRWDVKTKNKPSIELAKKLNFKLDKKISNDEWQHYVYK